MRVHPVWFFRVALCSVIVASWFSMQTRRRAGFFRGALRGYFDKKELRARARRYLFNLRLYKDLAIVWCNWHGRCQDWITVEGEAHLQAALQERKGAFLVSPHNYGFSKLVAPVLATRGYKVYRGGNGGSRGLSKRSRWGIEQDVNWIYLNYKGDFWQRARMLKTMQAALGENGIVHVSPRAYQQGSGDAAVEFFGRKYFLDPIWFQLFQLCGAPVLPCFVVGSDNKPVNIIIHPALQSGTATAKEFAGIESFYISKFPEYGRMWKNVCLEKGRW